MCYPSQTFEQQQVLAAAVLPSDVRFRGLILWLRGLRVAQTHLQPFGTTECCLVLRPYKSSFLRETLVLCGLGVWLNIKHHNISDYAGDLWAACVGDTGGLQKLRTFDKTIRVGRMPSCFLVTVQNNLIPEVLRASQATVRHRGPHRSRYLR